jgi:ABC-2 type transport system permease protein
MTGYRVTFGRVVRSEWTKLRALRSTWVVLVGVAALVVGLAGVVGWSAHREGEASTVAEAVGRAFFGVDLFSLVLGGFGVLLVTGEYSSGLIRATLLAVPRRLPVLWAKALVLVAAAAPVMLVVCFASFLVSQAFAGAGDRVTFGDPEVLRATFGAAAAPVALSLLGLGLGVLLRHTAGTITAYVAVILVIPLLLPAALPGGAEDAVMPYVPTYAATAMYDAGGNAPYDQLSPALSALVVAGWVVLLLAVASAVLRRRDA